MSERDVNCRNVSIFIGFFSCPIPTLLLLAPILLGPGEATHSELVGLNRVKLLRHYVQFNFWFCFNV